MNQKMKISLTLLLAALMVSSTVLCYMAYAAPSVDPWHVKIYQLLEKLYNFLTVTIENKLDDIEGKLWSWPDSIKNDTRNIWQNGFYDDVDVYSFTTSSLTESPFFFTGTVAGGRKWSLWLDTSNMTAGDEIVVRVYYMIDGTNYVLYKSITYTDDQTEDGKLVIDQLPVGGLYGSVKFTRQRTAGNNRTYTYQIIMEQV